MEDRIIEQLESAYPALRGLVRPIAHKLAVRTRLADADHFARLGEELSKSFSDLALFRRELRAAATLEKIDVARWELDARTSVFKSSEALSLLARALLGAALSEARGWAEETYGKAITSEGRPCQFVFLGMGKLGGNELNAGSDIDLIPLYETDEGAVSGSEITLHEYFTKITQRTVQSLEESLDNGVAWKVDLRLRPEGVRGPLVNSLPAIERYYESFGRTWERAALLRAAPVAGDLPLGDETLKLLSPFVWRREVNPKIANELASLVTRARELPDYDARNIKLCPGGIREVEFFAQSLQLIWGGREPTLRIRRTPAALRRLSALGYVSRRDTERLTEAYAFLRMLEHRIQSTTQRQTHDLPKDPQRIAHLAKTMHFRTTGAFQKVLDRVLRDVHRLFRSMLVADTPSAELQSVFDAVEGGDEKAVAAAIISSLPHLELRAPEIARHIVYVARQPEGPFGVVTLERSREQARLLLQALLSSADPEQALRLLSGFFSRFSTPGVYVRSLFENPALQSRLVDVFSASGFVGGSLVAHPELFGELLFVRKIPTPDVVRALVEREVTALGTDPDVDEFVGALRRAKTEGVMQVGLADLAEEMAPGQVSETLTALADMQVSESVRFAMRERGMKDGLAVIAMGKYGGAELSYGSDLDLFFVYRDDECAEAAVRTAQRVIRLLDTPHGAGVGYELDTRLRPSGNQGLLVVSLEAFRRYHAESAQPWERQALLRARGIVGDPAMLDELKSDFRSLAYERGAPASREVHRLRLRMEQELAKEKGGALDLKFGPGGIVDVELAVQWLQMKHGSDPRVRHASTEAALRALHAAGYLPNGAALLDGYLRLREIERRIRLHYGTLTPLNLVPEDPASVLLARRLGYRDSDAESAVESLRRTLIETRARIRDSYLEILDEPS